jgi:hypothetical protein
MVGPTALHNTDEISSFLDDDAIGGHEGGAALLEMTLHRDTLNEHRNNA